MTTTEATDTPTDDAALEEEFLALVGALREQIASEITDEWDRLRRAAQSGSWLTPEKAAQLRDPFPPEAIGKLPRVSCRQCSDAQGKVCAQHTKQECEVCGNYMTVRHVHLDYVGHAAVTDRLLRVDPTWSWEPVAWDPSGAPMIQRGEKVGRLWIRLTICGVTRLGVGIAELWKQEVEKELIGDALRNAAMRFGVALDLWSKEDIRAMADDEAHGPPAGARRDDPRTPGEPAPAAEQQPPLSTENAEAIKAVSARVDTLPPGAAAAFKAWKDDQGFPWPWPMAACTVMLRKMDEIVAERGADSDVAAGSDAPIPPAVAVTESANALPPADDLPVDGPCELCGSTRAAKAIVHGVRRCQNAHDCKKRVEANAAKAAGDDHPPGDAEPDTERQTGSDGGAAVTDPTEVPCGRTPGCALMHEHDGACFDIEGTQLTVSTWDEADADHARGAAMAAAAPPAETGDELLYCSAENCGTPIEGELPVFGEHDEPYHVACAPAFQGS